MTPDRKDRECLERRGISQEKYEEEVRRLRTGFPLMRILGPATVGNGIMRVDDEQRRHYTAVWDKYVAAGAKVVKMVPASGAASRMFKNLFKFVEDESRRLAGDSFMSEFFAGIHSFAFFPELDAACLRLYNKGVDALISEERHREVVKALLSAEGLNYGNLPKALLEFHTYREGARTPLEEHLAEGAQYAAGADGVVRLHFTVSPEHIPLVQAKVREAAPDLGRKYGVSYEVSESVQKPSTDTVALGPDGEPFRVDGELFFRPGGHGALIENLGEIDADVIFLKNVDNVVPDSQRTITIEYKKVIGGILVETSRRIAEYMGELSCGLPPRSVLDGMLDYLHNHLCIRDDNAADMDDLELADYLTCKFARPLRVCGMVRNEGEPGGGPFLAYGPDGTVSPQILESSQLDLSNGGIAEMFAHSTHFNPVDLVCDIRDCEGNNYDLTEFVDPETGFVSSKSVKGVDIKALELPGLWNGAMSDWNTLFVEVPGETFNPVKTVNDLLRPAHQN